MWVGGGGGGGGASLSPPRRHMHDSDRDAKTRRKPPLPHAHVRTGREMYAKPRAQVTKYAEGVSIRAMARPGELVTSQPRFIYGRQ